MLLNYSTTQLPSKSIAEIQEKLADSDVQEIMVTYDKGKPVALSFSKQVGTYIYRFKLPCRYVEIHKLLQDTAYPNKYRTLDHALAVSWRILQDWVEAQMALIDAHLVKLEEVFLPYQICDDGKTIYERYETKLLSANGLNTTQGDNL